MLLNGIVGKVIGGTQFYHEDGRADQATAIQAGPCIITQVKSHDSDGYESVQLGFSPTKAKNAPTDGHMVKSGGQTFRYLREISVEDTSSVELGTSINVGIFEVGAKVNVTGTSKGKGFAGTVKRYNFKGGPKTHGQSDRHRAPGSIGAGTSPGRVIKGMKMAGRMGGDKVTVKNLEVLLVDIDRNLLLVKGSVPGHKDSILLINKSV